MEGVDIAGVMESWASGVINDAELHVKGFKMFRADRTGAKGGSLLLYVNKKLDAAYNQHMSTCRFRESLWCDVVTNKGKFLVGICYRSPRSDARIMKNYWRGLMRRC